MTPPIAQQATRGFTLVEVLVALVVLSIGLLGLAGLQTAAVKQAHSAYLRSHATALAYAMGDRMRANMRAVDAGDYNDPSVVDHGCTSTGTCSTTELAEHDAYEWTQLLAQELPLGTGTVCRDISPEDGTPGSPACDGGGGGATPLFAIKVWWDDDRDGDMDEEFERFVVSFRP